VAVFSILKDHPIFSIIGAAAAIIGIFIGVLSLTEPRYAIVTDGKICGFSEEAETIQPYKWKECENPSKVAGYKFSETVSQSSGWIDGGHDEEWHCTNVKREKEAAVGQSIVWSNQRSSQGSDKDWLGHVTYKYHCTIDAKWGPIYIVERWEGCGEELPATHFVRKAKTCYDMTKRIGWKWRWE
jgi:hypothetical protein